MDFKPTQRLSLGLNHPPQSGNPVDCGPRVWVIPFETRFVSTPRYIPHYFPMPWNPKAWPRWAMRLLVPNKQISRLLLRSLRLLTGLATICLQVERALTVASMKEWKRRGWSKPVQGSQEYSSSTSLSTEGSSLTEKDDDH